MSVNDTKADTSAQAVENVRPLNATQPRALSRLVANAAVERSTGGRHG